LEGVNKKGMSEGRNKKENIEMKTYERKKY
jgi:hypothetical protein